MSNTWSIKDTVIALQPLQKAYPKALDDDQLDLYIQALADIPPTILGIAVIKVIRTNTFFPSIAELRQAAKVVKNVLSDEEPPEWSLAFLELQEQIKRCGHSGHPCFTDPSLKETVKRMGWLNLCMVPMSSMEALRAQFKQIYMAVTQQCRERQECKTAVQQLLRNGADPTLCDKLNALKHKMLLKK